jgi:hypothetical protein
MIHACNPSYLGDGGSRIANWRTAQAVRETLFQKQTKNKSVNSICVVCDQKTSKFFIPHQKEFTAGNMGVKGLY